MPDLEEVYHFIVDSLAHHTSHGHGSLVSIRVSPYFGKGQKAAKAALKAGHGTPISPNDVIEAHEALDRFDGDFRKLFSTQTGVKDDKK